MRHPIRLVLLVVAVLMLLALDHGLPHRYVPDDTVVRCALGMARDLGAERDLLALVPPGGLYTTYPYLLPYVDLGVLGATYALGRVAGRWQGMGEFAERVFDDPTLAWLPARFVSVLLGLLVPLALYRAARELSRSRGEAALVALLGGSSLLLVQYAHTTRPWAPMLGFGAASLALTLRLSRRGGWGATAAAFAAAALSACCLQVGAAFLAVPVVGVLCGPRGGASVGARLAHLALGLAVALLLLGSVGYPHLVVHGLGTGQGFQTGESTLLAEAGVEAGLDIGGQAFDWRFVHGLRWQLTLVAWFGYDPLLVVLGALGLVLLAAERARRRQILLLIVAPALCFAGLFLLYDGTHVRYLMPANLFLALGAARVLRMLAAAGRVPALLALALLALPLVQAVRLDLLLGRPDTRTLAAQELPARIVPGELLAVDGMGTHYGPPLAPTKTSLQRYLDDAGARAQGEEQQARVWLTRNERRILEGVVPQEAAALDLLPIQRSWRYDSYYPTDFLLGEQPVSFEDFLDELGVDVYVQVDRVPDAERRRPVTDLLAARGRLIYELSPTGSSDPPVAELPTDMAFALTQLWSYERPGPWIRAWRLAPGDGP